MKRIYISGPITGTKDYLQRFEDAERELIGKGYTSIVNPARVARYLPDDFTHAEYMKVCMAELGCCEAVYMLAGWKDSKGACEEFTEARAAGMEIFYQETEVEVG